MRAADVVHLLGDLCAYCSGPADSIDHIDAIAVGGDGSWTNLTAACGRCNSTKVHKPLLLFLATRTHPVEAS
jgi:5-methylcytosine-specific restriction endonuclease McrA